MVEIISTCITVIGSIIIAVTGYRLNKVNTEQEKRNARRIQESKLSLELMIANMDLSEVCANALTGGHNNGNVEEAKKKVKEARRKYKEFQEQIVAEECC